MYHLKLSSLFKLQSDDFHLDRALYFACRNDRENLCKNVLAGEGRVYECLIQNKRVKHF